MLPPLREFLGKKKTTKEVFEVSKESGFVLVVVQLYEADRC